MEKGLLLSIIIPTFNHEKYIEKAVRSVLMQKVNFEYEVLIGEDCSTDGTRNVLLKLQKELPPSFVVLFREKNTDKGVSNFRDLYARAKGKYIIVLEGDDYWTYEYKLQKQVDFLEKHPDYVAVAHNVTVVDENDNPRNDYEYPECKKDIYTFKDYHKGTLAGQTATIMRRNPNTTEGFKNLEFYSSYPGDRRICYVLLCNGKVGCIQEKWSAYRYVTSGGSSFSATFKITNDFFVERIKFFKVLVNYTRENFKNNTEALYCIESLYFCYLFREVIVKTNTDCSFGTWVEEFKLANSKIKIIMFIFKESLNSIVKRCFRGDK